MRSYFPWCLLISLLSQHALGLSGLVSTGKEVNKQLAGSELQPGHMQRSLGSHTDCYAGSCGSCFLGGIFIGCVISMLVFTAALQLRGLTIVTKAADGAAAHEGGSVDREAPETEHAPSTPRSVPGSKSDDAVIASATADFESMHLFWPRIGILVVLMLIQSVSSFVLEGFQSLLTDHPLIISFLTMLVGAGGNVGGQSVVLVVRELACGRDENILGQTGVGVMLAVVLAPVAFFRCWLFGAPVSVTLSVSVSVLIIVVVAASLGTAAPLLFRWMKVDPAHATPVIQVLMDIVGVFIVCCVSTLIVHDSPADA